MSDSQTVFDKLLNTTGCSQTKDTIGCLQQVPADVILTATEPDFFSIVMDGLYVQRQPVESLLMGKFSRVPLLIGTNTNEGTYFTYKTIKSEADIAKYYNDTVPYINEQQRKELMRLYPTASYKAPYLAAADVVGDRLFQCPTNLMARVYADEGIPVFKYRWHHQMTLSKPFTGNASLGSFHFSEVPFVFNLRFLFLTHQEFILGRILNGMWVQFVVRGNPNLRQDPFDNIIQWPLYTKFSDYEQVVFQTPVESITIEDDGNREAKCLFWDRVGQSLIHQTRIAQVLY